MRTWHRTFLIAEWHEQTCKSNLVGILKLKLFMPLQFSVANATFLVGIIVRQVGYKCLMKCEFFFIVAPIQYGIAAIQYFRMCKSSVHFLA